MATIHDLSSLSNDELIFLDKMFIANKKEIKKFAIVSANICEHIRKLNESNAFAVSDITAANIESDYSVSWNSFAFIGTPQEFMQKLLAVRRHKATKIEDKLYQTVSAIITHSMRRIKMRTIKDDFADGLQLLMSKLDNCNSTADIEIFMFEYGRFNHNNILQYFITKISLRTNFTDDVVKKTMLRIKMENIIEK